MFPRKIHAKYAVRVLILTQVSAKDAKREKQNKRNRKHVNHSFIV